MLYDEVDSVDVHKIVEYVSGLQLADGSFTGDKWGEVDTRFSFCAIACLALLVRQSITVTSTKKLNRYYS